MGKMPMPPQTAAYFATTVIGILVSATRFGTFIFWGQSPARR